ncbi:hypothetical protein BD289DRAFT_429810 [Coniella lustricola]|uniref:Uncharacterized protein n=1 Tax=Coniella lustricola TaxID=2025994 RepID=A0A2T3ACN1_9PEZI|nr:hypothetical protein BD289DRAFT_429810 [Coniella lustricola]
MHALPHAVPDRPLNDLVFSNRSGQLSTSMIFTVECSCQYVDRKSTAVYTKFVKPQLTASTQIFLLIQDMEAKHPPGQTRRTDNQSDRYGVTHLKCHSRFSNAAQLAAKRSPELCARAASFPRLVKDVHGLGTWPIMIADGHDEAQRIGHEKQRCGFRWRNGRRPNMYGPGWRGWNRTDTLAGIS